MGRNEILIEVYSNELFRGYAAKFYPHLADEMVSELIVSLCTLSDERLIELHTKKELTYYSIAIIRNMAINPYSPFSKKFLSDNLEINDDVLESIDEDCNEMLYTDVDDLIKDVNDFLKERTDTIAGAWYDESLFNMHFNKDDAASFRAMSKITDIPVSSIYHSVKKTQDLINDKFKDRYNDIGVE